MAFQLSGPLTLVGYDESGRPDFGLDAASPGATPAPPTSPKTSTYFVPTDAEMAAAAKTIAVNKFGGTCLYAGCKEYVAPGAGQRIKLRDTWLVRHLPGQCPVMKALASTASTTPSVPVPVNKDATEALGETVLAGYFTAQFGDDQNDYVTIRVRKQPEDSIFKPGELIVSFLRGRDNESDYTKFAHIDGQGHPRVWKSYAGNSHLKAALAAVLGDQRGAGEAWARASKRCWRCGRLLTTPESLDRLLGEECANKG